MLPFFEFFFQKSLRMLQLDVKYAHYRNVLSLLQLFQILTMLENVFCPSTVCTFLSRKSQDSPEKHNFTDLEMLLV